MTTVASATSQASTAASTSTTSTTATNSATSTENQFLSILTTELTNQDPLNAMDTSTFTSQLVSYAGLEQQINTNSKLDGITNLLTTLSAQ
jgi:flagellar basal-body rod modification protein FlgD